MAKTAFITGISGQDGAYLAKYLLEKGYRVHGGVRQISQLNNTRLDILGITNSVEIHELDLSDMDNIHRVIRDVEMDEFYNLAAQSFVGGSWAMPVHISDVDAMGVVRILDSLRNLTPQTRFYQASSSEMFGLAQEVPQHETTRLYPRSPYGVAKVFGHSMTINYRESFGMHASSGILFNHESPLRGEEYVTRKITLALARIARGEDHILTLGNLDARRDWGFAGDYVKGMWAMLQQDKADDYVLATGVTTSIREFIGYAAEVLGLDLEFSGEGVRETATDRKTGRQILRVSKKFFRPVDVGILIGDAFKAREELGWAPQVSVRALAEMMARADFDALANGTWRREKLRA